LIDLFESKQMDIIYILQEGAIDNPLDSRLKVVGDLQYKKRVPNSFSNPNFKEYLKSNKIRHLYVTGLAAEFCVNATIQDAARRGYFVTAVSDGIAAGKCSRLEETLQEYEKKRIKVVPSETIIQE
jgi:nicotinamidase-related amidase